MRFLLRPFTGLLLLTLVMTVGCGSADSQDLPTASIPAGEDVSLEGLADTEALLANPPEVPAVRANQFPMVQITTSLGDITVKLNAAKAPETVDNFLKNYVERGFYADTVFHYVEPEFLIVGGGFTADLQAKETRAPILNEAANGLKNVKGTIGMSREPEYADSATSQFYFNLADNPSLDPDPDNEENGHGYCVFGEVVEGMSVVEKIAQSPVENTGNFVKVPQQPVTIHAITRLD